MLIYIVAVFLYCYVLSGMCEAALRERARARLHRMRARLRRYRQSREMGNV